MTPATLAALHLIERGVPLRTAAKLCGVNKSTLIRARARLGLAGLPRGRPTSKAPSQSPHPVGRANS